jgi:hypothetical protein
MNVAQIIEGVIFGILNQTVPAGSLDACVNDAYVIESNVVSAVRDFESLTFDGIKQGLNEAGAAVKAIPVALKECGSAIQKDLSIIAQMAEIFTHPFSLFWQVGKSLIVNGADIFGKINTCVQCYKDGKYYDFGMNLGGALSEVFFAKTNQVSAVKREIDVEAYDFLVGLFSGIYNLTFDSQALYNSINMRGSIMWGPVHKMMQNLAKNNGTLTKTFWVQLDEVEHIFLEGGDLFITSHILNVQAVSQVRARFDCFDEENLNADNQVAVQRLFKLAVTSFESENAFMVGHALSIAAGKMCPANLFLQ